MPLGTYWPTAQTLVGDDPDTLFSVSSIPGLGLGTWAHLVPSQCSARVRCVGETSQRALQ